MSESLPFSGQQGKPEQNLAALDGMRGFCSLTIFAGHLLISFWPVFWNPWDAQIPDDPTWPRTLARSPLRFLFDPRFALSLSFILSGFTLSSAHFRHASTANVASAAVRRLPRLLVPALFSMLLAFFVLEARWMYNLPAADLMTPVAGQTNTWLRSFYETAPSGILSSMLRTVLGGDVTVPDPNLTNAYNPNLWTLPLFLMGALLVYSFVLVALSANFRTRGALYLVGGTTLLLSGKIFLLDFLIGVALADLYAVHERAGRRYKLPALAAFALAGVAVFLVFQNPHGKLMSLGLATIDKAAFRETLAGTLLLSATMFSGALQWLFACRVLLLLGKISYSLYLLHLITICSMASYVYVELRQGWAWSHREAGLIACLACVAFTLPASWFMYILVDRPTRACAKLCHDRMFAAVPPQVAALPQVAVPALAAAPVEVSAKAA